MSAQRFKRYSWVGQFPQQFQCVYKLEASERDFAPREHDNCRSLEFLCMLVCSTQIPCVLVDKQPQHLLELT
jgi:hypothetical protein